MDPNDVKREIYEEGYSDYTGECYDGDDEELYDEIDECETDCSWDNYP